VRADGDDVDVEALRRLQDGLGGQVPLDDGDVRRDAVLQASGGIAARRRAAIVARSSCVGDSMALPGPRT
jgi:hypothetical protein